MTSTDKLVQLNYYHYVATWCFNGALMVHESYMKTYHTNVRDGLYYDATMYGARSILLHVMMRLVQFVVFHLDRVMYLYMRVGMFDYINVCEVDYLYIVINKYSRVVLFKHMYSCI